MEMYLKLTVSDYQKLAVYADGPAFVGRILNALEYEGYEIDPPDDINLHDEYYEDYVNRGDVERLRRWAKGRPGYNDEYYVGYVNRGDVERLRRWAKGRPGLTGIAKAIHRSVQEARDVRIEEAEIAERTRTDDPEARYSAADEAFLEDEFSRRLKNPPCRCGSGLEARWEYDAQRIPLCKVCPACREKELSQYRPEILSGYSQADVDEDIESDDPFENPHDFRNPRAKKLSKRARTFLPASDFVLPRERKWPIQDPAQAMTALTWSTWPQHKGVRGKVQHAVKSRYPQVWREFKGHKYINPLSNPITLPGYGRKHEYWNEADDVIRGPIVEVKGNPHPTPTKKSGWTAVVAGPRQEDGRYVFGHMTAKTLKAAKKIIEDTLEKTLKVCKPIRWRKVEDTGLLPTGGRAGYTDEQPRLMLLTVRGDWSAYLGVLTGDVTLGTATQAPRINPEAPEDLPEVLSEARNELLQKLRSRRIKPRSYKGWTAVVAGYDYKDRYQTATEIYSYLKDAKIDCNRIAQDIGAIGYGEKLVWRSVKGLPMLGYAAEHSKLYAVIFKGDWTNYLG